MRAGMNKREFSLATLWLPPLLHPVVFEIGNFAFRGVFAQPDFPHVK
jgi:hypothetical protein